jgi:acetyl-CoA C-acetyltransferase
MQEAYIVDAVRTAGGRRNGKLSTIHPVELGAIVINSLLERTGIDPNIIDDVIIGCVTQAGEQTFGFARNIVLASNLPEHVPAVTIDRQCGSSQQALHFAVQCVMSGTQDVVIAGGVESMSRVPMFSNIELYKKANLNFDPLSAHIKQRYGVDSFSQFKGAELLSKKYGFSRDDLDNFAYESHLKAIEATEQSLFDNEIVPVKLSDGSLHLSDEGIRFDVSLDSIAKVDTLAENGVITAANASQICDGASGLMVVSEKILKQFNLKPIARVINMTVIGSDPVIMLEGPIPATKKALQKAGISIQDIDLYEVNEAFAPVPLAWLQALNADPNKLNIQGGAIALGHALGSTGSRIASTLVHSLRRNNYKYGLQAICEGGGMSNVTIYEKC